MKSAKSLQNRRGFLNQGAGAGWLAAAGCLFWFAVSGAGCTLPVTWDPPVPGVVSTTVPAVSTWESVAPGVDRFDRSVAADGVAARFVVWRVRPEAGLSWQIVASTTRAASVRAWADDQPQAAIVVNGGYFHPDGSPSGWLSAGGMVLSARLFDGERSGFAVLGANPALLSGTASKQAFRADALQSFPWLINGGSVAFTQETGQYGRRTFIGTDAAGAWYVGVVPTEPVTLFQLAHLLLEIPDVRWQRVLNLDGGPSTGVVARFPGGETVFDSFSPIPYVIVARPVGGTAAVVSTSTRE